MERAKVLYFNAIIVLGAKFGLQEGFNITLE